MLRVVIGKMSFDLPTLTSELNLSDAIPFALAAIAVGNSTTQLTRRNCVALLSLLCNIPKSSLRHADLVDLQTLVKEYVWPLAEQVCDFSRADFEAAAFAPDTSFVLPECGVDVEGVRVELTNIDARRFCEASDLAFADPLRYAPMIVATLCGQGEVVTRKVREQALSVDVATANAVLRMLFDAHTYMRGEFAACYSAGGRANDKAFTMSWCDFLRHVARCVPSEVAFTQRMNCYDFMALAQARMVETAMAAKSRHDFSGLGLSLSQQP